MFVAHVPGVRGFLYRQQHGVFCLDFIQEAYRNGLAAFRGTALEGHLTRLLRTVVHQGRDGRPGAAGHLAAVAEAFMDCQAVQARAIERAGLQIRGVAPDFRSAVVALVGEYKAVALRMLAAERLAAGVAFDADGTPTHYENRLTADVGDDLGLDASDIRRARMDVHAASRFRRLAPGETPAVVDRCRELFDLDAMIKGLAAETSGLDADSASDSLPRLFLGWASESMTNLHALLDRDTQMRLEIGDSMLLAVLEVLFIGRSGSPPEELYRGEPLLGLFRVTSGEAQEQFRQQEVNDSIEGPAVHPIEGGLVTKPAFNLV